MPRQDKSKIRFGHAVAAKLQDQNRTLRDVAAKIPNTPPSQFTRWKTGQWTYIPTEKLEAVVRTVAPNDYREQADLILAYLSDMTPQAYRPTILLGQKGENDADPNLKPITGAGAAWTEDMRRRLDAVAAAYELNDEFAHMVDTLVAWAKRLRK